MNRRSIAARLGLAVGCVAAAVAAAPAGAQYTAPPPEPGFEYIFDGSATGSDASFDKWQFAGSTYALSPTQGRATLNTADGSISVNDSPFGAYWYPVRAFGDAVLKLQYTVQDTPISTPNGGVMIRFPDVRYPFATTAEVLAAKPTGYNFDLCGGATPFCGRTEPAPSTTYEWEGADGPFPPPGSYSGAYCSRPGTHSVDGTPVGNLAGTGQLATNGTANNHQHWMQVYCGHEIQINESLNGGGALPSSDPIKTGSVYGFRNLNSKQSGTAERQIKGIWHVLEIRTIGQQYTVLIDGEVVNQFDNGVPKIASRNGDPPTMARQFAEGYLGLQTHGGNDRISYREIQVKEIDPATIPAAIEAPTVGGPGRVGQPLTCERGEWENVPGAEFSVTWYRSNDIGPAHPRYRAPSQFDLGDFTTPAEPEHGTNPLRWVDSLVVGHGMRYVPTSTDVGKVIHCAVSADNGGATVWETAEAPAITAR